MTLEPTFSAAQVGAHLGLSRSGVHVLRCLGDQYGRDLHPSRGGLWPSFLGGSRTRRFPLGAVERHKSHLARLATQPAYCGRQVERCARLGLGEQVQGQLERQFARLTRQEAA